MALFPSTSRRQFIKNAAGMVCAPLFLQDISPKRPALQRPRNLVLIELYGGIDGLGVLVPKDNDEYRRFRPTLAIPSKTLLSIDDERGFPPYMAPFHELWQAGQMQIVEGVGYPNSSMSHFAARAIWGAAMPNHTSASSGWIARMRQHLWSDDSRPELLTHVGEVLAPDLLAPNLPVLCFDRPADMGWMAHCGLPDKPKQDATDGKNGMEPKGAASGPPDILTSLQGTLSISRRLGPTLQGIASAYKPRAQYPATDFGRRLQTTAALISAGFGSRVYSLQHGNFDIHTSDPTRTVQAPKEFAEGIFAFMKDLKGTSAFEHTLVLCHSEFGRRPKENSAGGCDHGAAGMMFLFGGNMRAGLAGKQSSITDLDSNGNMIPSMDFRSVYAAVIEQWFKADHVPIMLEKLEFPDLI